MKIAVIQHVSFEGPGYLEDWAKAKNYSMECFYSYEGGVLPAVEDFDLFIVMGGPMGVADCETIEWLARELHWLKELLRSGKRVLGFCLGAQLIAAARGVDVKPGPQREIGWFPLKFTSPFPDEYNVLLENIPRNIFHWHGDQIAQSSKLTCLASTAVCSQQVFAIGKEVLAFQCHPEMKREGIETLCSHCADEIDGSATVMSVEEMLAVSDEELVTMHAKLARLMDLWLAI